MLSAKGEQESQKAGRNRVDPHNSREVGYGSTQQIEAFWNENLCGKHFITANYPSPEFFAQYREFRYHKEHHLNSFIDWAGAQGKVVLEIGTGVGADATRWAAKAKSYIGIDLTDSATVATAKHLRVLNLRGTSIKANAENLCFSDQVFDIVYSHGVLHHVRDIAKALGEIRRVLKDDGQFILMLYSKDSFNYWIRIQFLFRIRFIWELVLASVGISRNYPWSHHLANFHERGWHYFSWSQWPHHCTDGPNCDVANIYNRSEITALLQDKGFRIIRMEKTHFPIGGILPAIERRLAKYLGFYQFVWAGKS